MTRDEAVEIVRQIGPYAPGSTVCSNWVELFEKLGMLKLDEPKSVEERVRDQARTENSYSYATEILMGVIDRAGLKIVDK